MEVVPWRATLVLGVLGLRRFQQAILAVFAFLPGMHPLVFHT